MAKQPPKPQIQTPIEFVSTDELMAELCKRFDNAIFAGRLDETATTSGMRIAMHGDPLVCVGLGHMVGEMVSRMLTGMVEEKGDCHFGSDDNEDE